MDLFKRGGGGDGVVVVVPAFCPAAATLSSLARPPVTTPSRDDRALAVKMVMKMGRKTANGMAMGGTGDDGGDGNDRPTESCLAAECDVLLTGS